MRIAHELLLQLLWAQQRLFMFPVRLFPPLVHLAIMANLDALKGFPARTILEHFAQLYTAGLWESGMPLRVILSSSTRGEMMACSAWKECVVKYLPRQLLDGYFDLTCRGVCVCVLKRE